MNAAKAPARRPAIALLVLALALIATGILIGMPAVADGPRPLGIACHEVGGVRFCEGNPDWVGGGRQKSFDGFPLDVDVTLPPSGNGPWPTLVMLHPWSTSKTLFEARKPDGGHSVMMGQKYNNNYFARKGYVVVNFTSRGIVGSCGTMLGDFVEGNGLGASLGCPDDDYLHFGDTRYEVRDAQHLVGRLVDQGIAKPGFAVTGESYGAGQSLLHAALRDKTVVGRGTTVPLRSPKGTPMEVKAVVATAAWSDFVPTALNNGRQLDDRLDRPLTAIEPTGVLRDSFVQLLYLVGAATGKFATANEDLGAAFPAWLDIFDKGEPYPQAKVDAIWELVRRYRSPEWIDGGGRPAPMMIMQGWTDDLFPPIQAIAYANRTAKRYPGVPIRLRFASIGHPRAQNKKADRNLLAEDAIGFLDHFMLDRGGERTAPGPNVRALGFTCPDSARSSGPFDAASWDALSPHELRFSDAATKEIDARGGREDLAWATDPSPIIKDWGLPWDGFGIEAPAAATFGYEILNATKLFPLPGAEACRTMPTGQEGGVADYRLPTPRRAYTMVGIPTVEATIATRRGDVPGELAAKLWDVDEGAGRQRLVTKGIYRLAPDQHGRVRFQLNGSAWTFQPGHHPLLEIGGRDDNSWRASNNDDFKVGLRDLELTLPTR